MKRLLLLATVFASVVLSSCSKTEIGNDTPNVIPENKGINFSGTTIDTKATMDPNTYKFSWVGGTDKIGIVAKNATEFYTPNSVEYTVTTTGASSPFSSATGIEWNGTGEHTFYASSPVGAFANSKFSFDLPQTQTQSAADNHDHVGASAIMFAKATAQANQEDAIALAFKHQMAFMEFRVSAATGNTLTISSIKVEAPSIYASKISYDLATEAVTAETPANALSLGLTTGMPVTTAVQKGWLAVLPGTYPSLKFTITYSDGQTQVIEKTPKEPATNFVIKAAALLPVGLTAAPVGGEEPEPEDPAVKLCAPVDGAGNYAYMKSFVVGDYSSNDLIRGDWYYDKTADIAANIVNGGNISIVGLNFDEGNASAQYWSKVWVDWNKDGNLDDETELVGSNLWVAGSKKGTIADALAITLSAPEGTVTGTYFMRIGTAYNNPGKPGGCGKVESSNLFDISIKFTSSEAPDAPAYCSIKANDGLIVKVDDADVVKSFTVSLTKKVASEVIIDLIVESTASESGTPSVQQVTIPAGQKTATASITFTKNVFTEGKKADVTVKVAPQGALAKPSAITSSIKYVVRGPGKLEGNLEYTSDVLLPHEGWATFSGIATVRQVIYMYVYSDIVPTPMPAFDFEITSKDGLTKDDFDVNLENILSNGQDGQVSITAKTSAKGKTGTFTLTSPDITFAPDQGLVFTEIK